MSFTAGRKGYASGKRSLALLMNLTRATCHGGPRHTKVAGALLQMIHLRSNSFPWSKFLICAVLEVSAVCG